MLFNKLDIEGSYHIIPKSFGDARGSFQEIFRQDVFQKHLGHKLNILQANVSVSAKGVVRGIHFAKTPPSQAKYVTCLRGSICDYIIDLRLGSPTFGKWVEVRLSSDQPQAVYLSEGLGHAFYALEDNTVVSYYCSAPYNPVREFGINPLDETVAIEWPNKDILLSDKDEKAPTLTQAIEAGYLSRVEEVSEYVESLRLTLS